MNNLQSTADDTKNVYLDALLRAVAKQHLSVNFKYGSPSCDQYGRTVTGEFTIDEITEQILKTNPEAIPEHGQCFFKGFRHSLEITEALANLGFPSQDVDSVSVLKR